MMQIEKVKLLITKYPILKVLLYPVILLRRQFVKYKFNCQLEVYNNLKNTLVSDPLIRVDEFDGIFSIDIRSDLFKRILFNKEYEKKLVYLTLKYLNKNKDAIDVGANIGFYTVLLAKNLNSDRKVLSIEPTKNALKRLYKNLELNNIQEKVIIFEGAVSDYIGIGEIKTTIGREEYSTLGQWTHPAIKNETFELVPIEVSTIDFLINKYNIEPGFIKIDVEGLEYRVLNGAKETLKMYRPIILSELSNSLLQRNGSSSYEVLNFLKSFNYKIIDAESPDIDPLHKDFTNILCIPNELNIEAIK